MSALLIPKWQASNRGATQVVRRRCSRQALCKYIEDCACAGARLLCSVIILLSPRIRAREDRDEERVEKKSK